MIERLTAIQFAFVQPIQESCGERGRHDLAAPRSRASRSKSTTNPNPAQAVIPAHVTRSGGGVRPIPEYEPRAGPAHGCSEEFQ